MKFNNYVQLIELLEFYRSKVKYSVQKMIAHKNKYRICSENTYNKIKKHEVVRNKSTIIHELFDRIDKPLFYAELQVDFSKLHNAVEIDNTEEITRECKELLDLYSNYRKYAYYDIVYQCIECVFEYYNGVIKDESGFIHDYLEIEHLLDDQLQDVTSLVLLYLSGRINLDNCNRVRDKLMLGKEYLPILIFNYAQACHHNYFLATELGGLIEQKLSENNYQRRCNYLSFKLLLAQQCNGDSVAIQSEIQSMLQRKDVNLSDKRKIQVMGNLIYTNILEKKYNEAIIKIDTVLQYSKDRNALFTIYKLFCMKMLGIKILKEDYSIDHNVMSDYTDSMMYEILTSSDEIFKENKVILEFTDNNLAKEDKLYIFMLEEIITDNCIALNKFKCLYEFKNIKDRLSQL